MVVVEIMAINGAIRLSQHLKDQKRLRKEAKEAECNDEIAGVDGIKEQKLVLVGKSDDCSTAGFSTSTATTCISTHDGRSSLQEHFEQLEQEQKQQQQQQEDNDDCASLCSLTSTIATASVAHSRFNCSFRPDDAVCFDDLNEDVLDSLDLSTHDMYSLTQRAQCGEDGDLEVAIQAAILAQEMASSALCSRPAPPRIKRSAATIQSTPPRQDSNQQRQTSEQAAAPTGSVKNFMRARVDTLARNTRVIDGFVQARVATFARNVETISMLLKGDCEEDEPAEDIAEQERPSVEINEL